MLFSEVSHYISQYFILDYEHLSSECKALITGCELKKINENDLLSIVSLIKKKEYKLIVTNRISRNELEDLGLIEFDDYLIEDYINKKIAIIYGNCHTTAISDILNQCKSFTEEFYLYRIKPIHTIDDETYFEHPIFKNCDLFIHQSIQKANRYGEVFSSENIIKRLNKNCKVVSVPNVYQLPVCFFPQYYRGKEFVRKNGNTQFFRDKIIDDSIKNSSSLNKCINGYILSTHFSASDLDKMLMDFFQKVEEREKEWDVKCLDFIRNNYQKYQLFYDPNHPTNILIKHIVSELLLHLGLHIPENFDSVETEEMDTYEMPLLPEVRKHFEMNFTYNSLLRKTTRNKVKQGNMTLKGYVIQYFSCVWQNTDLAYRIRCKSLFIYGIMKIYNKTFWKIFGK